MRQTLQERHEALEARIEAYHQTNDLSDSMWHNFGEMNNSMLMLQYSGMKEYARRIMKKVEKELDELGA